MEYEITIYDDVYNVVFVSEPSEVGNFIETATEVVRQPLSSSKYATTLGVRVTGGRTSRGCRL